MVYVLLGYLFTGVVLAAFSAGYWHKQQLGKVKIVSGIAAVIFLWPVVLAYAAGVRVFNDEQKARKRNDLHKKMQDETSVFIDRIREDAEKGRPHP